MKITDVIRAHIEELKRSIRETQDELTAAGARQSRFAQLLAERRQQLTEAEAALRKLEGAER